MGNTLLDWKASGNNGHHVEAHSLVNEYQLVEKTDGVELLAGPKFNATSGFNPVIRETFASREDAETFAHDFELAMLRQVAKVGIAGAYEGSNRSSVIVSKVEAGHMELFFVDKDRAGKPRKLKTELYKMSYDGTNGPVNGMRILLDDGTVFFKMTMGTNSEYAALAQNALIAVKDAHLLKAGKLSRRDAYHAMKRAAAREDQQAFGGEDKNEEICCQVGRGAGAIRFKEASEEFNNRTIGFTDGLNGRVHVAVFTPRRRPGGSETVRDMVMERDMDAMQLLTFAGQVTFAQDTGPTASGHNQHMDLVTHVADGDLDKALLPTSKIAYPSLQPRILPAPAVVAAR